MRLLLFLYLSFFYVDKEVSLVFILKESISYLTSLKAMNVELKEKNSNILILITK
jgi:hypothetical protein